MPTKEQEIIRHRQVPGLSVFLNRAAYRTPHTHPEWECLLVLENGLKVTCSGQEQRLEPGDMLLLAPRELHEFRSFQKPCLFLCLQISPQMLPLQNGILLEQHYPRLCMPEKVCEELKDRLLALAVVYFSGEPLFELHCMAQALQLLHDLLRGMKLRQLTPEEQYQQTRRSDRLRRLMDYVDAHYTKKIRLADFAAREGCSLSYLSHFIKDTTNQTFQQYVTTVRLNCACRLIAAGKRKMLDVCNDSGFSDYRYFVRAFREAYGVTPEEYARRTPARLPAAAPGSLHSLEEISEYSQSLQLISAFCQNIQTGTGEFSQTAKNDPDSKIV